MIITITLQDKDDGRVSMESDPPLTRLKGMAMRETAKDGMMSPATAYALVAIAAVQKRHREMAGKEAEWTRGKIRTTDIIKPN